MWTGGADRVLFPGKTRIRRGRRERVHFDLTPREGEHAVYVFFDNRTASRAVTVEDMSRQAVVLEIGKAGPRER